MKALYNITYGLFILTAKTNKYNGCVINTLQQVTSSPTRISITINKDNYTTKMIEETNEFNVSILDNSLTFDLIQRFGFASGKDTNKFENFNDYKIAKNGIPYITKHVNSYISAKVVSKTDLGSHYLFVADITDDVVLALTEPVTYAYYLNNIKPKSEPKKKKVYVCRICGYVYEGDELPSDFVCPICKHGAEDFELQEVSPETNNQTQESNQSNKEKTEKYYCPYCGNLEDQETEKCIICGAKMIKVEL